MFTNVNDTMKFFADGFSDNTKEVIMNPKDYAEFRKYCMKEFIPSSKMEELRKGIVGILWKAYIKISINQAEGKVNFINENNEKHEVNIFKEVDDKY